MAQTDKQEYWRKRGKERKNLRRWHIGNSETSTWCQAELSGGDYEVSTEKPMGAFICSHCNHLSSMSLEKYSELTDAQHRENERFIASWEFLESYEWRKLRMEVIKHYGPVCMCCRSETNPIHVDHIKPRKKRPDLALDFDNLQILCNECNHGKGNWDETDWRPKEEEYLPDGALQHLEGIKRH